MTLDTLPLKDYITLGAALLGACLGVMNTWNAMSQRRLRLKVTPRSLTNVRGELLGYAIEVINLSAFSITLAEVGFFVGRRKHMPVQSPHFDDGVPLPRRVEPREAVSAMFDPRGLGVLNVRLRDAYARTACGSILRGNSPAGRQLSDILSDVAKRPDK